MSDSVSAGLPFALFGSGTGVGTFSREGLARPARSAEPASATVNRSISGTGPSNGASRARPSSLPSFAGLLASEPSRPGSTPGCGTGPVSGPDAAPGGDSAPRPEPGTGPRTGPPCGGSGSDGCAPRSPSFLSCGASCPGSDSSSAPDSVRTNDHGVGGRPCPVHRGGRAVHRRACVAEEAY